MTISTEMMMYIRELNKHVEYTVRVPDSEDGWKSLLESAYMLLYAASEAGCPLMDGPILKGFPGEWAHSGQIAELQGGQLIAAESPGHVHNWPDGSLSIRVGKRAAGRLLDGVTHDAWGKP